MEQMRRTDVLKMTQAAAATSLPVHEEEESQNKQSNSTVHCK